MIRDASRTSWLLMVVFLSLAWMVSPSYAVVGGITDLSEFSDVASPYYGMNWSYNYATRGGTSTAIGYFTLVTASHYTINTVADGASGYDTFTINGDTWRIASAENLAPDLGQTPVPDIRVLHMENMTNPYRALPGFYDLYTYEGVLWPAKSDDVVIVGTGNTGSTADDMFYTDTDGTRDLRWGTNSVEGLFVSRRLQAGYSTRVIKMRYNTALNSTPHECGLGDGDSGCGVFVNDDNTWKLAGLGLYRDSHQGGYQNFHAAAIPVYADRLHDILQHDLLPGDLNLDGNVDAYDYITLKTNFGMTGEATWYDGDFDGDGNVGAEDLLALQTNFDYMSNPHPIMTAPEGAVSFGGSTLVPEPSTLLLLGIGAAGLTRRRRGRRAPK